MSNDGGYPFGVCPADIPDWEPVVSVRWDDDNENDIEEEEEDEGE